MGAEGVSGSIIAIKSHLDEYRARHCIVEDTDPRALVEKVVALDRQLKECEQGIRQPTTPLKELLDTLEERILIKN